MEFQPILQMDKKVSFYGHKILDKIDP